METRSQLNFIGVCFFLSVIATESLRADCVPQPAGLIHWYRGEVDGRDYAGTNHGSLGGDVTAGNPGEVGGAYEFSGGNLANGIGLGDVPDLDFTAGSSFTLEAWFKSYGPTDAANDAQCILVLNNRCGNTVQSLTLKNLSDQVIFQVRDINGNSAYLISSNGVAPNQFHHVVGVRQSGGGSNSCALYVDGALLEIQPDFINGILYNDASDFIGRRNLCGTFNPFNGLIDEISIYNRALSSDEVAALFAAGSAGKCLAPLLAIQQTGTNTAVVSWPAPSFGFGLQQNTNDVSSMNWSSVSTAPLETATNKYIIVDPPNGNRFYRLFKP